MCEFEDNNEIDFLYNFFRIILIDEYILKILMKCGEDFVVMFFFF